MVSLLGLAVIFTSGESYSQKFSSIFLFAKGATLNHETDPAHESGRDPLPEYLAKASVVSDIGLRGQMKVYVGKEKHGGCGAGYELMERTPP